VGLEEGHKNDQKAGALILRRKVEGAELINLEKKRLQGELIVAFQYLKGAYKQEGERLTRGNGFKLRQGRFRLDMRKKFFTQRVVTHWNRLLKEVVDAPSLEAFKARLDGQPCLMVGDPAHGRGVETR